MIERNCDIDPMERDIWLRSGDPALDEIGEALAQLIRETQEKIDSSFSKGVKYPAKLKRQSS